MQLQDQIELDTMASVSEIQSNQGSWTTKKNSSVELMSQETLGPHNREARIPVLPGCISIPVAEYPKD